MRKQKISDVVLVFDSYYRKQSNPAALIFKKVLLCCGIVLCAMMFIIEEYRLSVNKIAAGICCVLFAAAFSAAFVFVRKRFAVPTVLLFAGLVIRCVGEPFWRLFSYFTDKILLICDGRFFHANFRLTNNISYIDPKYVMYRSGELLGVILLIALFSMITAACLFNKPRPIPMIVSWFILWIPPIMGENLRFNLWMIPAIALYFGVISFSVFYSQGLAIGRGMSSYCYAFRAEERSFLNRTAKMPYMKRVKSRSGYYSKYYSAAVYVFAVFALLGTISSILLRNSTGIDYTNLYEFFISVGSKSSGYSPFESGPLSEYFANSSKSVNKNDSLLGLNSPGTGNQELLRVTNSGELPVYLRGDIGMDFNGTSWTSPVGELPQEKLDNMLLGSFYPAELNAAMMVMQYVDYIFNPADLIQPADVLVEYLCDTNIAFLPAYSTDFGHFNNRMFNIYGDFVARAGDNYEKIDTLQFTALVPIYTNSDSSAGSLEGDAAEALEWILEGNLTLYTDCFNSYGGNEQTYARYKLFVNQTYLDVPEELRKPLSEFRMENGLTSDSFSDEASKYLYAARVANFLRENYTYSLTADVDPENPVLSFLNDTKSGHCALYASAMTLILRMAGIPARYCTGFVVQPTDGTPRTLRAKNLHAWCEVYLGPLGWVTFDPTSAAAAAAVDDDSESDSMSSDSVSDESSSDVESDEISSDSSESIVESDENSLDSGSDIVDSTTSENPENRRQKLNIMPYVLGICGIVLIILAVGFVVYRFRLLKSNAEEALKHFSKSPDADLLLKKIHDIMRVCALTPKNGELPEDFYLRAEKTLGCAIYDHRELLMTAAFGDSKMCSCRELAKLLKSIYDNAEKSLNVFGKVRLRRAIVRKI